MISAHMLENALSKAFDIGDPVVANTREFDERVGSLLAKRPVVEGLLEYLKTDVSAPRAFALVAYSSQGSAKAASWVNSGQLPAKCLYRALMHDGSDWLRCSTPLLLQGEIVTGGPAWDFEITKLLDGYTHLTSCPGLINALVDRCRKKQRMSDLVRHIPMDTLMHILEFNADVFSEELNALSVSGEGSTSPVYDQAIALIRTHLTPEEGIAKLLNGTLIQNVQ